MSKTGKHHAAEIICLGLFGVTAMLLLIGAWQLPEPEYDPLGPAGLPLYIAGFITIMVLIKGIILFATLTPTAAHTKQKTHGTANFNRTIVATLIVVVFLIALTVGGLPFTVIALLFLIAFGFTMTGYAVNRLPVIVSIAVIAIFGLTYLFTELLGVVLPS